MTITQPPTPPRTVRAVADERITPGPDDERVPVIPPTEPPPVPREEPPDSTNSDGPYVVNDVSKMSLEASDSTTSRGGDRGIDNTPRLDRIARRAHEIYEARGGADGRNVEDWLQAEREIDDAAGLQEVPPRLISER